MSTPILRLTGDFAPQTVDKVERLLELLSEIHDHRYLGHGWSCMVVPLSMCFTWTSPGCRSTSTCST